MDWLRRDFAKLVPGSLAGGLGPGARSVAGIALP